MLTTEMRESYATDVVLRDGSTIRLRPVTDKDAPALAALSRRLAPEDHRFRFQGRDGTADEVYMAGLANADFKNEFVMVAETGSRIVAAALCGRSVSSPGRAEVALVTIPALRGRGIGTQMLERVAEIAREHGIDTFEADVAYNNQPLVDVFLKSGFEVERRLEGQVYHLAFPLRPTPTFEEKHARRMRAAASASMRTFFEPATVAVVGASPKPGSLGNVIYQNMVTTGFNGVVYPVNPKARVVGSARAYPTVAALPEKIDLAVIVVPNAAVDAAVDDCIAAGVRALVVISAGFAEMGAAGRRREAALVERIRAAGIRLIGPNCLGIANADPNVRLNATFSPIYPSPGRVAMLTQSGALGLAIIDYARRVNLGLSTFVSIGNKADVSGNDLLQYWMEDDKTDVILLYLESFGNPRRFGRIARHVAAAKPIVAVKSGRSKAGARAASSHSGSLASGDNVVEALFRQVGIIRTDTLEQMFDVAMLLARQPIPAGRRVAVLTNAGGPAVLAADALEAQGLEVPPLSDETVATLRSFLPEIASVANPVDMIGTANGADYGRALAALLADAGVDSVIVIYIPVQAGDEASILEAIGHVSADATKPILLNLMRAQEMAGVPKNLPTYLFPESAATALGRVTAYGEWCRRPRGVGVEPTGLRLDEARAVVDDALARGGGWLDPAELARLAAAVGIALPASKLVATPAEAEAAANQIGFPVVVKAVGPSILHKSEVGGVVTNLPDAAAVRATCEDMAARLGDDLTQIHVQAQIKGRAEVLIGATVDPTFGPLLVYGSGGVLVELMKDVAFRLVPLTDRDVTDMLDEVKGTALLRGYRGAPKADEAAVRDILFRLSALLEAIPEIQEVDLNPVLVLENGACAVDARVRVERLSGRPVTRRIAY